MIEDVKLNLLELANYHGRMKTDPYLRQSEIVLVVRIFAEDALVHTFLAHCQCVCG
jgi:hypothetical protein